MSCNRVALFENSLLCKDSLGVVLWVCDSSIVVRYMLDKQEAAETTELCNGECEVYEV